MEHRMSKKNMTIIYFLTASALLLVGCAAKEKATQVAQEPAAISETQEPAAGLHEGIGRLVSVESEILPEQLNIVLESDKKLQYSAYKLTEPERMVLELANTEPGEYTEPIVVDQGIVRKITPIFFKEGNITRIEVALDAPTEYNISKKGDNAIVIEIKNTPLEEGTTTVSAPAPARPEMSTTPVEHTQEAVPADSQAPMEDEARPVAAAPATPPAATEAAKEENQLFASPKAKEYTGRKISLDFQKADVKNVLRILSEISGYNLIIMPDVKGNVTMRLKNVPWDQAMEIVLKNNKLGMELEGNILRIATAAQIKAEMADRMAERQKVIAEKLAKKEAEPLVTKTVNINYADIKQIAGHLKGLKSTRGTITTDSRTFTIIMVDIKENLKKMKDLIQTLDTPPKQVSIEARIVEISRRYSKGLGIQWGGALNLINKNANFPNTVGITGGGSATKGTTNGGQSNYLVDLPAAAGAGSGGSIGFLLGHIAGTQLLDVQLTALEAAGKAKILSNPRITTKDNVTASIVSGKEIPFETISDGGTNTEWKPAQIQLTTTPHITPDGYVSLTISAQKAEPDTSLTSAGGVPTITTRNMNTEVLVKDGDTAVLGGLFTKNEGESRAGVPWLSKIPMLGWLFRNESVQDTEEELLFFITPRILKRMASGADASSAAD